MTKLTLFMLASLVASSLMAADSEQKKDTDLIDQAKKTMQEVEKKNEAPKAGNQATKIEAPRKDSSSPRD